MTEGVGEGTDEVRATVSSYALSANIENRVFTGGGAFTGTGNAADNTIKGGGSNDVLSGRESNSILNGGSGNDLLDGGSGADRLIGGSGTDTATYATSSTAVTVNLATGANSRGDAEGDVLSSIENLTESGFADTLILLEAVERRFGTRRAPERIEFLTDNGSPYIARETRVFPRQIGLKSCFTPVKRPQSNGMAEAFVNTLKRDYVSVSPLPDAETALRFIPGWFEDYNESHPH